MLAAARAVGAEDVERFAHGTTAATNALLERRGARTAFVGTAGFEHLLHLRRQTRAHLYRLCAQHPEPLVPLERCHARARPHRPGRRARAARPRNAAGRRRRGGGRGLPPLRVPRPRTSGRSPTSCARRHPGVHVVASHEVAPEFREYERASTVAADAYLAPVVSRYLHALAAGAREAGLPEPLVMLSSGGVATLADAAGASGDDPRLRPRRRRRRRRARRAARRLRARDRVRHGRHVDRRMPPARRPRGARARARRRRASGPAADRRPAHRGRGRRLARAASTPAARSASARRAPARIPAPPATARAAARPSPTRTSSSAGFPPSCRAASSSTATRRRRRSPASIPRPSSRS